MKATRATTGMCACARTRTPIHHHNQASKKPQLGPAGQMSTTTDLLIVVSSEEIATKLDPECSADLLDRGVAFGQDGEPAQDGPHPVLLADVR
jgi:hypothetical protein